MSKSKIVPLRAGEARALHEEWARAGRSDLDHPPQALVRCGDPPRWAVEDLSPALDEEREAHIIINDEWPALERWLLQRRVLSLGPIARLSIRLDVNDEDGNLEAGPATACPGCGRDWTEDGLIVRAIISPFLPLEDVAGGVDADGWISGRAAEFIRSRYYTGIECRGCQENVDEVAEMCSRWEPAAPEAE